MKQNKTTKTDNWQEEFDKFELGRDETGQQCYFIDSKPIDEVVKSFIRSLLSHQRQEILDQVEKEVIGEDEAGYHNQNGGFREGQSAEQSCQSDLRRVQRQKLSAIRKEGK